MLLFSLVIFLSYGTDYFFEFLRLEQGKLKGSSYYYFIPYSYYNLIYPTTSLLLWF